MKDSPQTLKVEKGHGGLIINFYVSPSSPPLQSRFKYYAKLLTKNSTNQGNITISRQKLFFYQKHKKTTILQQVTGGKIPNLVLKIMLEPFLKIPPLKKRLEF